MTIHVFAYRGNRKRVRRPFASNDNGFRASPTYYEQGKHGELRPIPGFPEGFYASESGHIVKGARVLGGHLDRKGYPRVTIRQDGKDKNHPVHKLVAAAWIGPRPEGWHVDHIDFEKSNNRPQNLRYLPAMESVVRRRRSGGHPKAVVA